ncbi:glutathionyl-hydroquinone reductase YqjG [Macadamia integrifolia]|uniref:glutathionyl-hydroquinone reductase YqjG n=1 Tax=Macadamia integrifolia TaxID=60698 RepID=UPI001C4F4006|nr:glutathionyl-hydroquinone reductase YqjG [Macadamia integrifolia]
MAATATSFLHPTFPSPGNKRTTRANTKSKIFHVSPRMSLQQQPPQPPSPPPAPITDLLTTITGFLWGKTLPPQLLISTVRTTWNTTWQLMMKQLAPSDPSGSYTRPASQFRANLQSVQVSRQNPSALHLYVGLSCPWAHRTLIVRALKGLEEAVPVSIASPGKDGLWEFRQVSSSSNRDELMPSLDNANGCKTLKEVYGLRRGGYSGRSSVPLLWDVEKREVICNESSDIIEFFNSGFDGVAGSSSLDLSPPSLKGQIKEWNRIIYPNVNNGVYRCGFAQSQEAYDVAVNDLFSTLDMLDDHLANSRYLCGDVLTLADVCLFTTLIRFDIVYNVLFKCTKKKLLEYNNLHGYLRDIYQIPKVASTCNLEAIMDGYFKVLFPLNPGGIRPVVPTCCEHEVLSKPHNRGSPISIGTYTEIHVS